MKRPFQKKNILYKLIVCYIKYQEKEYFQNNFEKIFHSYIYFCYF